MGHTEYEIVIPLLIPWISKKQIIFIEIQWSAFITPLFLIRVRNINIKIGEKCYIEKHAYSTKADIKHEQALSWEHANWERWFMGMLI